MEIEMKFGATVNAKIEFDTNNERILFSFPFAAFTPLTIRVFIRKKFLFFKLPFIKSLRDGRDYMFTRLGESGGEIILFRLLPKNSILVIERVVFYED